LNHKPYKVGAYGDNYEIRIAQIQSPTRERLLALESYYNYTLKPRDSYTEPEVFDIEYEVIKEEAQEEAPF
jgi:hypothetical protein